MKDIQPAAVQPVEGSAEARQVIEIAIREGEDIYGLHFVGANIDIDAVRTLEFHDCIFENCRFIDNKADKLVFVDVRLEDCDLSNLNMNSGVFQRVEFCRCRATGLVLSRTLANHVRIRDCVCRYLNLCAADWRNASFEKTDLTSASVQECRLKAVKFTDCKLTCVEFCRTPLAGMDLTTNDIEGISIAGGELRGAIVTAYQASELAKLLGVLIR